MDHLHGAYTLYIIIHYYKHIHIHILRIKIVHKTIVHLNTIHVIIIHVISCNHYTYIYIYIPVDISRYQLFLKVGHGNVIAAEHPQAICIGDKDDNHEKP